MVVLVPMGVLRAKTAAVVVLVVVVVLRIPPRHPRSTTLSRSLNEWWC